MPSPRDLLTLLAERRAQRARSRATLQSLYDLYPAATAATRRGRRLVVVPVERIVGTARQPSQNTADFKPLPELRGRNWLARWQRITRAIDRMALLPPVELLKVGDDYFVVDGHNRVAAALERGVVAIDADVTELMVPAVEPGSDEGEYQLGGGATLVGGDELRQAATGRQSRTAEHRMAADEVSRGDLVRDDPPDAEPP